MKLGALVDVSRPIVRFSAEILDSDESEIPAKIRSVDTSILRLSSLVFGFYNKRKYVHACMYPTLNQRRQQLILSRT